MARVALCARKYSVGVPIFLLLLAVLFAPLPLGAITSSALLARLVCGGFGRHRCVLKHGLRFFRCRRRWTDSLAGSYPETAQFSPDYSDSVGGRRDRDH